MLLSPPSVLIMGWEVKCSWPSLSAFPMRQETGTGTHIAQWFGGPAAGAGKIWLMLEGQGGSGPP